MGNKFDVLVTDSEYKHALAAVRCLGRNKLKVMTCSKKFSPTRFSRFSKASFRSGEEEFIKKLLEEIKKNKVDLVMPIGYYSNILCSKNKDKIKKFSNIIIADYDKMLIASNKEKMAEFVKKLKISAPKTWIVKNIEQANKIQFDGPMIIKSSIEMRGKKVEYVEDSKELKNIVKKRLIYGHQIVQERIFGFGCGFFALYKNGKLKASFQHKRMRQYPCSGGTSSAAESYYDKELEIAGGKILDALKWEGVAMIEFIYDLKDKKYKFIEMNPKYWGSLDLAIASKVEFPYLEYLLTKKGNFKMPEYEKELRFQWVLPEDTLRIKTCLNRRQALKDYLGDLFNPAVKKDIGYIFIDPLPTIIRLGGTIVKLFKNGI